MLDWEIECGISKSNEQELNWYYFEISRCIAQKGEYHKEVLEWVVHTLLGTPFDPIRDLSTHWTPSILIRWLCHHSSVYSCLYLWAVAFSSGTIVECCLKGQLLTENNQVDKLHSSQFSARETPQKCSHAKLGSIWSQGSHAIYLIGAPSQPRNKSRIEGNCSHHL